MSTSITTSDVRTRWPALTTTVIADGVLTTLITEADNLAPSSLSATVREYAVRDLAAHLAILYSQASSLSGMTGGARSVVSASHLERSVSFDSGLVQTVLTGPNAALYSSTAPGRAYLALAASASRPVVSYPGRVL